jgi:phosphoribosylamine--glycine ligase
VIVAPGNDGMCDPLRRRSVAVSDHSGVIRLALDERVTLVVIGPEAPLAAGLADEMRAAGVATFGPGREGARLEASKSAAKQLMQEAGIPTARAEVCDTLAAARAGLDDFDPPWVVKADGLASGKGVLVTAERAVAESFLVDCFERGRFGAAGRRVLLEEFSGGRGSLDHGGLRW